MTRLAKVTRFYLDRWWCPLSVTGAILLVSLTFGSTCIILPGAIYVAGGLLLLLGLSVLGILVAAGWNLAKKRWRTGSLTALTFLPVAAIPLLLIMAIMSDPLFGNFDDKDDFGKDIVIPPDMTLEEPLKPGDLAAAGAVDREGDALVATFAGTGKGAAADPEIDVRLPELNAFAGPDRELLLRHLATSAKWFLSRERGKLYACRRCVVHGQWQKSMNGYFTAFKLPSAEDRRFQFRILLGPDGVVDRPARHSTTAAVTNQTVRLRTVMDNGSAPDIDSHLVLTSKGAALEVFEQSTSPARPFTPLALAQVRDELRAVLASPVARQQGFDPSLMPAESVKEGDPEIHIAGSGGVYQVFAYANPREAGQVYLKVFEATRNTRLSPERITERSQERIGWSANPRQRFFVNAKIMVYEGDWGVYYPARFELWFTPDSGKPDRKLVENTFKIEGWQR